MKTPITLTIRGEKQDVVPVISLIWERWPGALIDSVYSEMIQSHDGVVDEPCSVRMTLDGFTHLDDPGESQSAKPGARESGLPTREDEIPY